MVKALVKIFVIKLLFFDNFFFGETKTMEKRKQKEYIRYKMCSERIKDAILNELRRQTETIRF